MPQRDILSLTNQVIPVIQHELGITSEAERLAVKSDVLEIFETYCEAERVRDIFEVHKAIFETHKAKIRLIPSLSRKLQVALSELPYGPIILNQALADMDLAEIQQCLCPSASGMSFEQSHGAILQLLEAVADRTEHILKNGLLIDLSEQGATINRRKNREIRLMWDRILALCANHGRRGYTKDGPIVRVIAAFHRALGLEPPTSNAARNAIREFQKSSGVINR